MRLRVPPSLKQPDVPRRWAQTRAPARLRLKRSGTRLFVIIRNTRRTNRIQFYLRTNQPISFSPVFYLSWCFSSLSLLLNGRLFVKSSPELDNVVSSVSTTHATLMKSMKSRFGVIHRVNQPAPIVVKQPKHTALASPSTERFLRICFSREINSTIHRRDSNWNDWDLVVLVNRKGRNPSSEKRCMATSIGARFFHWLNSSVVGGWWVEWKVLNSIMLLNVWNVPWVLWQQSDLVWWHPILFRLFVRWLSLLRCIFLVVRLTYRLLLVVSFRCTKRMTHVVNRMISSHISFLSTPTFVSFLAHHPYISKYLIRCLNVGGIQRENLRCRRINTQHVFVACEGVASGRSTSTRLSRWIGWSLRKSFTTTSGKSQSNHRCGAHTYRTKNIESSVESRFRFSGKTNDKQRGISKIIRWAF